MCKVVDAFEVVAGEICVVVGRLLVAVASHVKLCLSMDGVTPW